jgi:hypothetical protein
LCETIAASTTTSRTATTILIIFIFFDKTLQWPPQYLLQHHPHQHQHRII